MVMSVETYRRNLKWLNEKRKEFPYECRTKLHYPKLGDVEQLLSQLNIVCCPLPKERVWLFATEEDMLRFKMNWVTLDNKN